MNTVKNSVLKEFAGGKIFSTTFVKKNGSIRLMVCRTGVSKYLNPDSKGLSDKQKEATDKYNLLTVLDNQILLKSGLDLNNLTEDQLKSLKPYRRISCDRILEIKGQGLHWKRESLDEELQLVE
jgi:hypothetical protein